jgi:superfamily II DNA or RNA helicase
MTLWLHQTQILSDIRAALTHPEHSCVAAMPTGAGKSRVMTTMLEGAYRKGNPALITVPSQEILDQFVESIGVPVEVLRAGKKPDLSRALAVVAMSQTLARRDVTWPVRLILDDEIHRLTDQRIAIAARLGNAYRVGFTATPSRLAGTPLTAYSPHLVLGPQVPDLQALGLLSPTVTFRGPSPSLQGIKKVAGDYSPQGLQQAHRPASLIGEVPKWLKHWGTGRRIIGFSTGVEHSADLVAACGAAGLRTTAIDGNTPSLDRRAALDALRAGSLDVLWNCMLLVEGLNLVECDAVSLNFSTLSVDKYMQAVGRCLRMSPHTGKVNAHIYDFGGNSFPERHGLVDQPRDWEQGGKVATAKGAPGLRTCEECLALWLGPPVCPRCGHVREAEGRDLPRMVVGEMAPVVSKAELERLAVVGSRATGPRPCPSWAATDADLWTRLERKRHREGYALGDGSRAHPGWTAVAWQQIKSRAQA